jgi:hypothetical protein
MVQTWARQEVGIVITMFLLFLACLVFGDHDA